jgi:primary-amine oxidase
MINIFMPLSQEEQINIINYFKTNIINVSLLKSNKIIFDYVGMKQPPKEKALEYLNNSKSIPPKRTAEVRIYEIKEDKYTEYEVLLEDNNYVKIIKSKVIKGARPSYNDNNADRATSVALKDERVIQALLDSGVKMEEMQNIIFSLSIDGRIYKSLPCCNDKECKKLKIDLNPNVTKIIYKTKPKPHSYYLTPYFNISNDEKNNSKYNQPIGDILILYDILSDRILKVYSGKKNIPIRKDNPKWNARPVGNVLNTLITSITKNNFTIKDNIVEWSDWRFIIGFDPTVGLVLYNVSFLDRTVWIADKNAQPVRRDILYQANLAELITIYASPDKQTQNNFLDLLEYKADDNMREQVKGLDYPEHASLLSFYTTTSDGRIRFKKDIVSIYEKESGFLWRHEGQGLSGIELYVSTLHVIGNYDYIFNWIFTLDGRIKFQVCPSGIIEASASNKIISQHHDIVGGSLVSPNIVANTHSHCANVRIDFAVDGKNNTIAEINSKQLKKNNPYGNAFDEEEIILKNEKEARRNQNSNLLQSWVVYNKNSKNYLGDSRGYKIEPGKSVVSLYQPNQRICKRANFLLNDINVSLYRDGEYYSMGKYPVESEKDTGIRSYIKNNENIVNKDIVVWHSFGFGHKPHVEQYPVMNKELFEFSIVPHNFFNENPALYINNL